MEINYHFLFNAVIFFFVIEQHCSQSSEFTCKDGRVISAKGFCDGVEDCDGSDKILSTPSPLDSSFLQIRCFRAETNRQCLLHRDYICNGTIHCVNITFCDVGCPSHYKCQDNSCVLRSTICDGDGCNGCSENDDWTTGIGFKCVRNGTDCLIPQQLLWDNVQDCDDGSDFCYVTNYTIIDGRDIRTIVLDSSFNHEKCFMCFDGSMVVPRNKICDEIIDCSDLSDECLCSNKVPSICDMVQPHKLIKKNSSLLHTSCEHGQILCSNSNICIDRSTVCDGTANCPFNDDERYDYCQVTLPCRSGLSEQKGNTCRCDGFCKRQYGVLCDGVGDCPVPLSGIAHWSSPPGFPADECWTDCQIPNQFECTNDVMGSVGRSLTVPPHYGYRCERLITLSNESSSTQLTTWTTRDQCNGILKCTADFSDEKNCPKRFTCPSGAKVNIPIEKVCDGFVDCDNGWDENRTTCRERNRFFCPTYFGRKVSVPMSVVCDFNINCDNEDDERNCTTERRFYCENEKPLFVKLNKMFNGRADCSDWSDECPTTGATKQENLLASRYELIGNPFLRALVWIMGITAMIGNMVIIVGECEQLQTIFRESEAASFRTNHMLILNLAISDFLMGVYLIMLGIVGVVYSGIYCSKSLEWLTSQTCVAMGVLVVLSSETSMLTMVFLTLARLYTDYQPFSSLYKPSKKVLFLSILFAWLVSSIIAVLPLAPGAQSIFVEKAKIQSNPFFGEVVHFNDVKKYAEQMLIYSSNISQLIDNEVEQVKNYKSWKELENFFGIYVNGSDSIVVDRYFGYYTANSVCIPNFFVTRKNWSWKFSLSITIFNFVGFLFVAMGNASIVLKVRQCVGKNIRQRVKETKELQRKVLRLLVTDFCCWIPLCIVVFVNFSGVQVGSVAYAVAAIVLLPINSALNPILYSKFIDGLWLKLRSKNEAKPTSRFPVAGGNARTQQQK